MKNCVIVFTLLLLCTSAWGRIRINDVDYSAYKNGFGKIKVSFTGTLQGTPELRIDPKMIQIAVPGAEVWPKINKKAAVVGKSFDTELMAYQYNKNLVRVRAYLPYKVEGQKRNIHLNILDKNIELVFPKNITTSKTAQTQKVIKKKSVAAKKVKKPSLNNLDENYLDKLLASETSVGKKQQKPKENNTQLDAPLANFFTDENSDKKTVKDEVKTSLSGTLDTSKKSEKSINYLNYIGKFVALLGVVLLLFYGMVTLMKKGVLSKGKLGFLNNTKMVQVLSTTHIAPKRSIMLVQVHNQVFLVGNTENGLSQLGELNDVSGLLKTGEKEVAGNNFDTDLEDAGNVTNLEEKVKLKADQQTVVRQEKDPILALAGNTKEEVRFSDKIKEKVKGLKPLH